MAYEDASFCHLGDDKGLQEGPVRASSRGPHGPPVGPPKGLQRGPQGPPVGPLIGSQWGALRNSRGGNAKLAWKGTQCLLVGAPKGLPQGHPRASTEKS